MFATRLVAPYFVPRIPLPVFLLITLAFVSACLVGGSLHADTTIDFNRDIRPLLSNNCLACHGFDSASRSTDLRLDTREGAIKDLGGYAAVVPGDPEKSILLDRIKGTVPEELMPPVESHKKPLSAESIELVRRWIKEAPIGVNIGRSCHQLPRRFQTIPKSCTQLIFL